MKVLEIFKEEDHRRALYASLVFIMLMILFFLLVSLEEPDPPLVEEIISIEMPDIEIEQGSQAAGGSESSADESTPDPSNEVQEVAQDVVTQEEETVYVPSGNGNTNTENTDVSESQPDETFGFPGGGSGTGTGNGTDFGDGDGVGGNGNGDTPGDGSYNPDRKVTKSPSFEASAQEEGSVALDIWVDANGNVIKTRFKESKSTTGSQYLIGLAVKAAKTMRYDKQPGVPSEHVGYKVFSFRKS